MWRRRGGESLSREGAKRPIARGTGFTASSHVQTAGGNGALQARRRLPLRAIPSGPECEDRLFVLDRRDRGERPRTAYRRTATGPLRVSRQRPTWTRSSIKFAALSRWQAFSGIYIYTDLYRVRRGGSAGSMRMRAVELCRSDPPQAMARYGRAGQIGTSG